MVLCRSGKSTGSGVEGCFGARVVIGTGNGGAGGLARGACISVGKFKGKRQYARPEDYRKLPVES
jgi:hypothetical protein